MEFFVNPRPCLLLEVAELVYAYINQIPAEKLTCDAPYAIPASEVHRIMEQICAGLDAEEEELQFYFHGVPMAQQDGHLSCVCHAILYCNLCVEQEEPAAMAEEIKCQWREMRRPFEISSFNGCSLGFKPAQRYTTITKEIQKLPIPPSYQMELIEAFSGFEYHADRLCQLLTPLAERLKPLLEPWVQAAAPLRTQWEQFLMGEEAETFLQQGSKFVSHSFREVRLTMSYFSSLAGVGVYRMTTGTMCYRMSASFLLEKKAKEETQTLNETDFSAIRLLSTPDRYAVFHALRKEKKTIQELANELGVNPGTIFRMVNNMYNVGLLNAELSANRNYYTVNHQRLKELNQKLQRSLEE